MGELMTKKNKDYSKLTKSEIDRDYLDKIGISRKVSVKRFQEKVLPNITSGWDIRGSLGDKTRQKHCRVYDSRDIVNWINNEIKKIKDKNQ